MKNNLAISYKVKRIFTLWPSNSILRYLSKRNENIESYTLVCIFIHSSQKLIMAICPSTGEWIGKITIESYNGIPQPSNKWKWIPILTAKCMNLWNIMQAEARNKMYILYSSSLISSMKGKLIYSDRNQIIGRLGIWGHCLYRSIMWGEENVLHFDCCGGYMGVKMYHNSSNWCWQTNGYYSRL